MLSQDALIQAAVLVRKLAHDYRHPLHDPHHRDHAEAVRVFEGLRAVVARHHEERRRGVAEQFAQDKAEWSARRGRKGR